MKPGQLLKYLSRHPDRALQIGDDMESKALLTGLGLICSLHKPDGPNLAIVCSPQLQTHWIIGSCWTGYPEGDGYIALFLPKLKVTETNLKKFIDELIEVQGGAEIQRGELRLPVDWPKLN
jgi:hypothetical protein